MVSARRVLTILAVLALAVSLPAAGAIYTVHLENGTTIDTRYQPVQSPTDPDKMMLLTSVGNWISLPKDAVTTVVTDLETRGFGLVVDTTTILIGMSLNDAAEEDGTLDPAAAYLQYLQERDAAAVPYSVQQFVNTENAGGIPLSYVSSSVPPIGASDRFLTPQSR